MYHMVFPIRSAWRSCTDLHLVAISYTTTFVDIAPVAERSLRLLSTRKVLVFPHTGSVFLSFDLGEGLTMSQLACDINQS